MDNTRKFTPEDVAKLDGIVTTIKTWQLLKMLDVDDHAPKSAGYHAGYSSTREDFGFGGPN